MTLPVCGLSDCHNDALWQASLGSKEHPGPAVFLCLMHVDLLSEQSFNIVEIINEGVHGFFLQPKVD